MTPEQAATRRSWNAATRAHNAHKGDQAAFLRAGGDTLFPEELELLGPLAGVRLLHLQCNAGQDSLCLARRGADVVGVDLSDEAIAFARRLSADAGIAARFEEAEINGWLATTDERFDVAFASYGVLGWNPALEPYFAGVRRVLRPGGRLVVVEFHPLVFSLGPELALTGDDYFASAPFVEPVGDYVADSGVGLLHGAERATAPPPFTNPHAAYAYQHTLATTVTAAARAGLRVESLHEWPYANGWRGSPGLVPHDGRRWTMPPGRPRVPMMFGLVARAPD